MALGGVFISPQDGSLGGARDAATGRAVIIGASSSGEEDTPLVYGSADDVVADYGFGPLVDAVVAVLQSVREVIVCRAAAAAGVLGATTATLLGSTGTFVFGGTPRDRYELAVEIVTGGAAGDAEFRWSVDGGETWSRAATFVDAAPVTLGDTGVTVTFTDAEVDPEDSWAEGATWTSITTAPSSTALELGAALDACIASELQFEAVLFVGPTIAATWTAMAAKAVAAAADEDSPRWFYVMMQCAFPDSDAATWAAARIAEAAAVESNRLSVCAVFARYTDPRTGDQRVRNLAPVIMGRDMRNPVQRSSGRVADGALLGAVRIYPSNYMSITSALDDARFTTGRTYSSRGGVYVNKPRTMSALGSDYEWLTRRRVMDRACRLVDSAAQWLVQDEVDTEPASLVAARERLQAPVDLMARAREVADGSVDVPLDQDILSTETLAATISLQPRGYAHRISVAIRFVNPFAA